MRDQKWGTFQKYGIWGHEMELREWTQNNMVKGKN